MEGELATEIIVRNMALAHVRNIRSLLAYIKTEVIEHHTNNDSVMNDLFSHIFENDVIAFFFF